MHLSRFILSALETGILGQLAIEHKVPELAALSPVVLDRTLTGIGSFTELLMGTAVSGLAETPLGLNAIINVNGVPNGLSAILFIKSGCPYCLEIHSFGGDLWNGDSDGFQIVSA